MAALAASSLNGVKIYNLSSGKTLPQWLAQKTKRSLAKDEEYRRRIELLQDFHFPTASQRIKMTRDGNFVVATGVYPPSVKVYDVRDLSLKFERRLDAEVVQFECLSEDFGKLVFLQSDRSLAFHAPYGGHYNLRIPKFGRDMVYHRENCNLYVAASANEVYRVNLDQGQFMAPLEISAPAANVVKLNPVHQLLGIGCEEGIVECWDSRSQSRVGILHVPSSSSSSTTRLDDPTFSPMQVTALEFDEDGLTFAVGTSEGNCLLYDLRSSKPLLTKSHQYGLPILDLKFHNYARKVMSTDPKVIKIWDKQTGDIFTNVETPSDICDVCVVESSQGKSGVLLVAGEQERVMAYYVPELGIAPKWCSFLDSLTEELEEEATTSVYEDYKFVTRQEIKTFGLEHMIGTPLLKAYMHGFFMDARLYEKVKAIAEPFAYDLWRKDQIQKKLEAKHANRITIQRRVPKVNRAAAEKLLLSSSKKKKKSSNVTDDLPESLQPASDAFANPLGDDRFARMFTSKDFEIDEQSETYQLLHPTQQHVARHKKDDVDSDADENDDDDDDDDEDVVAGRFDLVSSEEDDESEPEGKGSDESSDEEAQDDYKPSAKHNQSQRQQPQQQQQLKKRFYELAKGEKMGDLIDFGLADDRNAQKQKRKVTKLPFAARVQLEQVKEQEKSRFYKSHESDGIATSSSSGGYLREMSFVPQSDRRSNHATADDEQEHHGGSSSTKRAKRGIGQLRLREPSTRGGRRNFANRKHR